MIPDNLVILYRNAAMVRLLAITPEQVQQLYPDWFRFGTVWKLINIWVQRGYF